MSREKTPENESSDLLELMRKSVRALTRREWLHDRDQKLNDAYGDDRNADAQEE